MLPYLRFELAVLREANAAAWRWARTHIVGNVVASLLTALFTIAGMLALFGKLEERPDQVLWGVVAVAIGAALWALVVFVVALASAPYRLYARQRNLAESASNELIERTTPKIRITGAHLRSIPEPDKDAPKYQYATTYVRGEVEVVGNQSNCRVQLVKVEIHRDGGIKEIGNFGYVGFPWADVDNLERAIDMSEGVPRQFDIFRFSERGRSLTFCHGICVPYELKGVGAHGVYVFDFVASCSNSPSCKARIEVNVPGNGRAPAVRMLQA